MNTILVGVVVGFILGVRCNWNGGAPDKMFGSLLGSVIGGILALFAAVFVGVLTPRVDVVYGPAELVSMRSSDGFSGTFIWGSGHIGSERTYHFMRKMNDGSYMPDSIDANHLVRIIEDESLKGIGYWRTTIHQPNPESFLYNWGISHEDHERVVRQEFTVPKGTVVQTFSVK